MTPPFWDQPQDMMGTGAPRESTGSTIPDPLSVEEYGRLFNAYRQGKYLLPHDGDEQNRLDLQHHVFQTMLRGRLCYAPIEETASVLDLGTGTGIWAIEFATRYPRATVVGTDISLIQPTDNLPPNCRFEREDAEDEWMFDAPFDLIRWRLMAICFSDYPGMIAKIYSHLAPSGWAEFHEWAFEIVPENAAAAEYYSGSALEKWLQLVLAGTSAFGRDLRAPLKFRSWMIDAGFTEVTVRQFNAPLNGWPLEPGARTLGNMVCVNCLQLMGSTTKILAAGGLPLHESSAFLDEVRKNLKDNNMRVYFPCYVTYGRKPEMPVQQHGSSPSRYIKFDE